MGFNDDKSVESCRLVDGFALGRVQTPHIPGSTLAQALTATTTAGCRHRGPSPSVTVPCGGACCHHRVDGAMQMVLEVLHQTITPRCHTGYVIGLVKMNVLRIPRCVSQFYGQKLMSLDRSTQGGSRSRFCLSIDSKIAEVSVSCSIDFAGRLDKASASPVCSNHTSPKSHSLPPVASPDPKPQ